MLVALAFILAQAQIPADTYGKTEVEILRMGQTAWYKFYTAKSGESTYGMSNALGIYADVAAKRNDRLLADPKTPHRVKLKQLSTLLTTFGGEMVELGRTISGGGTMWGPIANGSYADAQDAIYALIHPQGQKLAKPSVVSAVTNQLATVPASIKEAGDVMKPSDQKQALADLADARSTFVKIVKLAAQLDRQASDKILSYCKSQADLLTVAN